MKIDHPIIAAAFAPLPPGSGIIAAACIFAILFAVAHGLAS